MKRYREPESFPGFEIDEIAARRYVKAIGEVNLPPVRFAEVGTPAFFLNGERYTGFYDDNSKDAANGAALWLAARQEPDGGFELAGFPGFETPDAILAIAEDAQSQSVWNKAQARSAIENTVRNGNNPSGALPDAPLSGKWFSAQFQELMKNAHPAL